MPVLPERCRLCRHGSTQPVRQFTYDPYARRPVALSVCDRCSAYALVPTPSDQLIADQYVGYFDRRTRTLPQTKVSYGRWLLRRLGLPLDGGRVLDVGAGEGHLLRAMLAEHPTARVHGVEPLWSSALARDLAATVYREPLEPFVARFAEAPFDAVFALDVLEHLVDPRAMLEQIGGRLVRPGGWFVATMPSADAWSRRMLGRLWPQYKIEHLHYFSRQSLEVMTAAAGLTVARLEPHTKRLPLGYLRDVGQSFGPPLVQRVVGMLGSALPAWLAERSIAARFGEWLLVARRAPEG